MVTAPKGEGWIKCPSVTTGGKAHFWFRRNPETDEREWFVWDRVRRQWVYQVEQSYATESAEEGS